MVISPLFQKATVLFSLVLSSCTHAKTSMGETGPPFDPIRSVTRSHLACRRSTPAHLRPSRLTLTLAFRSTLGQIPARPYVCTRVCVTPPLDRGRATDERARPAAPDGRPGPSTPVKPGPSPVQGFARTGARRPRRRTPASPTRSAPGC